MVWVEGHLLQAGKYRIEKGLKPGGFGITYLGWHVALKKQVVIKTPNDLLQNDPSYPKFVERFRQEGQVLAKFNHPHIVRVADLFMEQNIPCLVMDFIAGKSLFEVVQGRGKLPEAEAVRYIKQIARALKLVHGQGLVHRDAHPGNIMVPNPENAILIDFGIVGEMVPTTVSSKVLANPAFAPYEQQILGEERSPAIDIYTLAASLYYAVTGQLPTPSMQQKWRNKPLTEPKNHNASLSHDVNRAILKGMALEPEHRPPSIQDWLQFFPDEAIASPISEQKTIPVMPKKANVSPISKRQTLPVVPPTQPEGWKTKLGKFVGQLLEEPSPPLTPPSQRGEPSPPLTPPSQRGEPTPPLTPPSQRGEPSPPLTPPSQRGEPSPPLTPPSQRGELEPPLTPPSQRGELEPPLTPPSQRGELEPPLTPPSQRGDLDNSSPLSLVRRGAGGEVFSFNVITVNEYGQKIKEEQKSARYFRENLGKGVNLDMIAIPGGSFLMGSPEGEEGSYSDERPQHQVTIKPFYMGKYAVTQAQWQRVALLPKIDRDLKPDPAHFQGGNRPVEQVSWYDAVEFCRRLSQQTGRKYRLPSEAEWEYACRARTTTPFHFGETITTDLANYRKLWV